MEDHNRTPIKDTNSTSPPSCSAFTSPTETNNSNHNNNNDSSNWSSTWFMRRESAATFESSSTIVESSYSGSSDSNRKGSKDALLAKNGEKTLLGDMKHGARKESIKQQELLGNGVAIEGQETVGSERDDAVTVMSMRAERAGGVGTFKTIAGLVCVIGGTGTLGIPKALAESGWLGTSLIFLALIMSTYTGHILIQCLYLKTTKRRESYQDIARDAYGAPGHYFALAVVIINLFGCAVLYVILSATLIEAMTREYGHVDTPVYVYVMVCTAFVWICLICTKSMKEIALLSILGACATVGVVYITVGMSVDMLLHHYASTITATHKLVDWAKLPLALATISFAYGGNVVYPHVEQSMRYPCHWTKALWVALLVCFVMYISIAVAGYAAFGNETLSPILRNLPSGALSVTANSLITVHVLLAAPILLTSLSMMIERSITKQFPRFAEGNSFEQFLKRAGPRTVTMFLTGLVAGIVPYFGDVMDLLGSLTQCLLVFVMPIVFYYRLGGLKRASWFTMSWALSVLIIGLIAMVLGTVDAVKHLIADFTRN